MPSQGTNTLGYEPDGDLSIEFALAEAIYLATQELNSHDAYTCLLDPSIDADFLATIPFIDVAPNPLLECLDVGSASTMSGFGHTFMVAGENELRDTMSGIVTGTAENPTLFGSVATCNGKLVADGRINAFDLAVLMWASFGKAPYDTISLDAPTVHGRNQTALRCGNNQTLQEYALALDDDFCAARQDFQSPSTGSNPPYRCLETSVEPWASIASVGEWTRLRFFDNASVHDEDKLALALELYLVGVDGAQATLDDEPPPVFDCTDVSCAPTANPRVVSVHLQPRDDIIYGDDYVGACNQASASISPVYQSGRFALGKNGVLSIMQDQPEAACPFDVFVWVPILLRDILESYPDQACDGKVGVQVGSAAMDGIYGAVQCSLVCVSPRKSSDGSDPQGQVQVSGRGSIVILIVSIIGTILLCCAIGLAVLCRFKVARPRLRRAVPSIPIAGARASFATAGDRASAYIDPRLSISASDAAHVPVLESRVSASRLRPPYES